MRILACLLVTGLKDYADAFLRFLNSLNDLNIIDTKRIQNPLETMWNLYDFKNPDKKQKAMEMCFIPYEDFPSSLFPLKAHSK